MWLSAANAVAGMARSAGTVEAKRQQTSLIKEATRFWGGTWLAGSKPKAMKAKSKRR
jgi:hypothetical protein